MFNFLTLKVFCLATVTLYCDANSHYTRSDEKYSFEEFFRDDFNASDIDSYSWDITDSGLVEDQEINYLPKNVIVADGNLRMQAKIWIRQRTELPYFSCGGVSTRSIYEFQHGEVEWRAQVPKGKGLRSSLWLLPVECLDYEFCTNTQPLWPQSVAVLDADGDRVRESIVAVRWRNVTDRALDTEHAVITHREKCDKNTECKDMDMSLNYHHYKLVWLPNKLTWFIDGKEVFNASNQYELPAVKMQIVMELCYVAASTGNTNRPSFFKIDYVTIRKLILNKTSTEKKTEITQSVVHPAITGSVGATFAVAVIIGLLIFIIRRRNRNRVTQCPRTVSSTDFVLAASTAKTLPNECKGVGFFVSSFEMPANHLEQSSVLLGKGQFGSVWKGLLKDGSNTVVAIKTFLDNTDCKEELQRNLFVKEMKTMMKVGRHLNIVNLLGFVTSESPILMVLEYCSNGSLRTYLHKKRISFCNYVDKNGILMNDQNVSPVAEGDYLNDPGSKFPPSYENPLIQSKISTNDPRLSTNVLIHITHQISRGLEYLAARSIIHRDLAARNVLVCENNIVKISDFGLAREQMLSDYVLQNVQVALPIKWMAPESILERCFSYESDIWSFGILTWEIFSLGEAPFTSASGLQFSGRILDFAQAISSGMRMPRPYYSPIFMYDIMLSCWSVDKTLRPSASSLQEMLYSCLPDESKDGYLLLDEPYQNYNMTLETALLELPNTV